MQTFVVAQDVILKYPKLATKRFEDIKVVLSEKLCRKIIAVHPGQQHIWLDWLQTVRSNPNVCIIDDLVGNPGDLSEPDYLKIAMEVNANPVSVLTDNEALQRKCITNGVMTLNTAALESLLQTTRVIPLPIDNLRFNVFLGLALLCVIAVFYSVIDVHLINDRLRTVLVSGALIIFGFFLFTIRQRFKLAYAIVEIVVGIAGVCYSGLEALKVIGGLYIMVRGLDNMGVALKQMKLIELYGLFRRVLFLKEEEKN